MSSPLSTKHYAIRRARADTPSPRWVVTLYRRGAEICKAFCDQKYGSTEAALAAAIAFRDQVLADIPPLTLREMCAVVRRNNKTGVPGVHRLLNRGRPKWMAVLNLPDGRHPSRSFSIAKYGEEEAYRLAVAARAELLQQVEGYWLRSPYARQLAQALPVDDTPVIPALPRPSACADNPYRQVPASGQLGVTRVRLAVRDAHGRVTRYQYFWQAFLGQGGRRHSARFPIARLGEAEALQRALAQRRAWEAAYRSGRSVPDAPQYAPESNA